MTAPVLARTLRRPAQASSPAHRTGLDGIVPPGMRAMRVVVTDAIEPHAGRGGRRARHLRLVEPTATAIGGTEVVAAGVTVLGIDRHGAGGNGRAGTGGVTLLVDPDQASALADAQANGVVTLALVPPEDADHP